MIIEYLVRRHRVKISVDVVQVPVLDVSHVSLVLGHGHLGPVEHGGLVHVVPRVDVQCAALNEDICCSVREREKKQIDR